MIAILIILEILRDTSQGDKHDLWSDIRLVKDLVIVELFWLWLFANPWGFAAYSSVRFVFFNYGHNAKKGIPLTYVNKRGFDKIFGLIDPIDLLAVRLITLSLTIYLL